MPNARLVRTRPVHCRCRKCRARCTLPKKPDEYDEPPICKSCGEGVIRYDAHHDGRPWRAKEKLCHCDGVWFSIKGSPHRLGGWKCNHNPRYWDYHGENE